jgi:hypothetical protein
VATLPKLKLSSFKNSSILGRHLAQLSRLQPQFAQEIFPLLTHDLLLKHMTNQPQVRKILSHQVNLFFQKHFISTGNFLKLEYLLPSIRRKFYLKDNRLI